MSVSGVPCHGATVLYISQRSSRSQCPTVDELIEKTWCRYDRRLLSQKEERNFAATRTDLEGTVRSTLGHCPSDRLILFFFSWKVGGPTAAQSPQISLCTHAVSKMQFRNKRGKKCNFEDDIQERKNIFYVEGTFCKVQAIHLGFFWYSNWQSPSMLSLWIYKMYLSFVGIFTVCFLDFLL